MFVEALDSSLLIVPYVTLKARKKLLLWGIGNSWQHNTVYVTVGFNLKAVVS